MLMSYSQKIGKKHGIKIANRSFEDVGKFKYRGTIPTDQNCMHEEMACYRLVQSLLCSCLLSGCETWSLTLREEHSLMVFESRLLRRIFGPKRDEVMGEWRKLHIGELQFVLITRYD
jgi:hypothetical protein